MSKRELQTRLVPNISPETIGFDFDGVIADIGEAFIRLACRDYGYCTIELDDIRSFQVESCLDIPRPIVEKIFDDILKDSLGTGLIPLPGAISTIEQLSRQAIVTIITARPEIDPVRDWLAHYFSPKVQASIRLIATGDHDNKESFIRECGLVHFVDDRTLTCQQLAEAGLNPLVFTQPWNRNQHDLPTVESWEDVAGLFGFRLSSNTA